MALCQARCLSRLIELAKFLVLSRLNRTLRAHSHRHCRSTQTNSLSNNSTQTQPSPASDPDNPPSPPESPPLSQTYPRCTQNPRSSRHSTDRSHSIRRLQRGSCFAMCWMHWWRELGRYWPFRLLPWVRRRRRRGMRRAVLLSMLSMLWRRFLSQLRPHGLHCRRFP